MKVTDEMLRAVNAAHGALSPKDWIDDTKHLQCTLDALAPFLGAATWKNWLREHLIAFYSQKASKGEIPAAQVSILTDMDMAQMEAMAPASNVVSESVHGVGTGPIHRTTYALSDIERWKAEAARYRWLQNKGCGNVSTEEECYLDLNPRDMDMAIDAAMEASNVGR